MTLNGNSKLTYLSNYARVVTVVTVVTVITVVTVVTKQQSSNSSDKKCRHKLNVNVLPETYIPSYVPLATVLILVKVVGDFFFFFLS